MVENRALHKMNPQTRFSNRAEDYAKYRPSYASEAIDCILEGIKEEDQLIAADIGAGTGISSRLLADRGMRVFAIEPNVTMRQVAEAHSLVEFRDGSAEATRLPDKSVDLITCFQAFHWFKFEPTLQEFARILKPTGKIALLWNDRDIEGNDQFTIEHNSAIVQAASKSPILSRLGGNSNLFINSLFPDVTHYLFPYQQALTKEALIGLALSASYIPKAGDQHKQLIDDLTKLHQKYSNAQDLVFLHYQTSLYLTKLASSNN
ncbi:MAG: class I SAM-dependent methyltransferase [Cyanobacteria bacterium P01_F01_bin.143]